MGKKFKPNLSDSVKSTDCKGCGKCCEYFAISYPKDDGTLHTQLLRSEMQRFMMLEGIGEKISIVEHEDQDVLVFDFPCRFLKADKTCNIYKSKNRPLLCRHFPFNDTPERYCPKCEEVIT